MTGQGKCVTCGEALPARNRCGRCRSCQSLLHHADTAERRREQRRVKRRRPQRPPGAAAKVFVTAGVKDLLRVLARELGVVERAVADWAVIAYVEKCRRCGWRQAGCAHRWRWEESSLLFTKAAGWTAAARCDVCGKWKELPVPRVG